ncbi:dihydrofolate reductase [Lactococcus hodotermopsidis]|uniref:Dihydrofolate reductase n=1 Tax=Pseudolactococcus hodotermopsidis TaxID=2709157 RepID=A0A6A0BCX5_9LACT|nr:dihydrofolate reductase [Lactococcus hodotermopsidis]GFH43259.1 dihydrofolate reductase [Lactococcus hodotermopsidis]
MVAAIWAEDEEGVIGVNGTLPWSLPGELQHFKETTYGQAILMGRKTFDGMKRRALPGRLTIVLTRDSDYQVDSENVQVFRSRKEVLDWYQTQDKATARDLFVIGGAEMFTLFDGCFERLYRTIVHGRFDGDTSFPENFKLNDFCEISSVTHASDEKNNYGFTVKTYESKK